MVAVVLRLLRIFFAYFMASLITGYVVYGALQIEGGWTSRDPGTQGAGFGLLIAFMITWLAAFPAALTITFGEWKGWRMWWYYSAAGSLIGLVLGYLFKPPAFFPWLGVSFGVVSGLIYWSIAGRHAGAADEGMKKATVAIMALATCAAFFITFVGMFGSSF
jgi:hypothetical protein